jgi:hypothetical protein
VAVIIGWTVQWYGNVPASVKVTLLLPPGGIFPESQAPESLVAVCATPSEFFHVTVVPFGTVSVEVPKAMLFTTMVLGEEFVVPPDVVVDVLEYGLVMLLVHPPTKETNAMVAAKTQCHVAVVFMFAPLGIIDSIRCFSGRAATMVPIIRTEKA